MNDALAMVNAIDQGFFSTQLLKNYKTSSLKFTLCLHVQFDARMVSTYFSFRFSTCTAIRLNENERRALLQANSLQIATESPPSECKCKALSMLHEYSPDGDTFNTHVECCRLIVLGIKQWFLLPTLWSFGVLHVACFASYHRLHARSGNKRQSRKEKLSKLPKFVTYCLGLILRIPQARMGTRR